MLCTFVNTVLWSQQALGTMGRSNLMIEIKVGKHILAMPHEHPGIKQWWNSMPVWIWGYDGIEIHKLRGRRRKQCASEAFTYWMLKYIKFGNPLDMGETPDGIVLFHIKKWAHYDRAMIWAKWGGLI